MLDQKPPAWRVVTDECMRRGAAPSTTLRVGLPVKIGIEAVHPVPHHFNAELVWVRLTSVADGGARLKGTLLNQPGIPGISLNRGDEMEFSNRDVMPELVSTMN